MFIVSPGRLKCVPPMQISSDKPVSNSLSAATREGSSRTSLIFWTHLHSVCLAYFHPIPMAIPAVPEASHWKTCSAPLSLSILLNSLTLALDLRRGLFLDIYP